MNSEHSEKIEQFGSSIANISKTLKGSVFYRLAQTEKDILQNNTLALFLERYSELGYNLFPQIRFEYTRLSVKVDGSNGDMLIKYGQNKYILLFHSVKSHPSTIQLENCNHRNRAKYGNEITHSFILSPIKPVWNWIENKIEIDNEIWEYISYESLIKFMREIEVQIDNAILSLEPIYWYKYLHLKEFILYCEFSKQTVDLLNSDLNELFFLPQLGRPEFYLNFKYWHYALFFKRILQIRTHLEIECDKFWIHSTRQDVGKLFIKSYIEPKYHFGTIDFRYVMDFKTNDLPNGRVILVFGIQIEEGRFRVFIETDKFSTFYFRKASIRECLFSESSNMWFDFISEEKIQKAFLKYPVHQRISFENNLIVLGNSFNHAIDKGNNFYFKELYLHGQVKIDDLFSLIILLFEELDIEAKNPSHKMYMLLKHL